MLSTYRTEVELVSTLLVEVRHFRSREHESTIHCDTVLVHYDSAVGRVANNEVVVCSAVVASITILNGELLGVSFPTVSCPNACILGVEEVECASAFLIPVSDVGSVSRHREDTLVRCFATVSQIDIHNELLGSPVDCDCLCRNNGTVRSVTVVQKFLAC